MCGGGAYWCCFFGLHCGVHGLVAAVKEVELGKVQTGETDAIQFAIKLPQVVAPARTQECGEREEVGGGG